MDRWISELYCSDIFIFNGCPLLEKCKEAKENGRKILLGAMIFLTAAPAQLFSENCTLFLQLFRLVSGQWKSGKIRRSEKARSYW